MGSGYYCGPLQISWPYWADGGKLGDKGQKHDFEDCLTSKECAEKTMRNYMRKYSQDCNGDGLINCVDFAILHKTGYRQCQQSTIENTAYWREFAKTQCHQEGNRNLIRESSINRNSQPNVVRNVFSSSSSSSSVRNVRRTVSNDPNHNVLNNERNNDLRFNRNTFKELDNLHNSLHSNLRASTFDNFDNFNHPHTNANPNNNLHNLHNNNPNELTIETTRIARPAISNRNNNNLISNNRKPLNSINRSTNSPRPGELPRNSDLSENSVRVINNRDQPIQPNYNPNPTNNNNLSPELKLSNATVNIDGKCLDCICYGSTKCNLKVMHNRMKLDNFNLILFFFFFC